ncbi:MAG: sel1 repeat family protein [Prevotellaceae bacterium]|nr:sel1 repeat family protein [Prevotellaceae bacterium]
MEQLRCGKCGKIIGRYSIKCPWCNSPLIDQWTAMAEAGSSEAQDFLAWCYYEGNGVEKDDVQAAKWWSMAAAKGNSAACNSLGACYNNGVGVEKDEDKAIRLFMEAASWNYVKAQYNLGQCFRFGMGVEIDLGIAVKWYEAAAKQGDLPSKEILEEMGQTPSLSTYNPDILYCNHNDHIKAIMHPKTLIDRYLGKIINKSDVYKTFDTMMPIKERTDKTLCIEV